MPARLRSVADAGGRHSEGAVRDPRQGGRRLPQEPGQTQRAAHHGHLRLQGLLHQHQSDDRVRRPAGHQRQANSGRIREQVAAPL